MKKLNKLSLVLLLGSLISVASCGNTPSSSEQSQPESSASSPISSSSSSEEEKAEVEITFYSTMGKDLKEIFSAYLEDFQAEYPYIKVNHNTDIGSYDDVRDQTATELSVGIGPDLVYCYADHVALYNKTKKVVALDKYIDDEKIGLTDEQYDDYIPGYLEEGRQFGDGKMYMLPWSKSTEILYYNVDVFEEHNLQVPTKWFGENDPTSMEYVCKVLKTAYPDSTPLGYDSESNFFITQCEQLGLPYTSATGENFLFNTADHKEFVEQFKGWVNKGYLTTQKVYGGYTSGLFVETTKTQRSFMSIGSSAGASHQIPAAGEDGSFPFEVGMAQIPQHNENNKKVISQGPSVCILDSGNDEKIEAAWLLAKWFTTNVEFQAEFSMKSGYVPVIQSVMENEDYAKHIADAENLEIPQSDRAPAYSTKICMAQVNNYFTSPSFIGSSEARSQVGNLITAYFSGSEKNIDTAFADAIANCKAAI